MLAFDEESGKETYAEDFTVPTVPTDLTSLEVWAHQHPNILLAGRITHLLPKGLSEEEKDEKMAKLAEEDPVLERYKGLNEDVPMPDLEFAWLSQIVGDIQPYN